MTIELFHCTKNQRSRRCGGVFVMTTSGRNENFAIVDERTLEYRWGWTFFFDSRKYVETRDSRYKSPNRAAFMVDTSAR